MTPPEDMIAARKRFYDLIDSGQISLGETLKAMRKLIGKTQEEFSELVGVGLPAIRAIEQGKGNPTLATLEKIGAPFGIVPGFRRKYPGKAN